MDLTVQNVYGLLLRSKLMSVEVAKAMYSRWHEEARDSAGNVARFASWMVSHRYLTEYQAALLARGHADGFFLNDYKILDRRGKGRMAGVYKAQHQLGQVVAIKVLPPSKAKDAGLFGRFQREAKLAIRLKHPNIVRTFQVGVAEGVHYLVMEYLDGETLEEIRERRKRLPPPEAVRLVFQALQGLQHIHQLGLVHRDLKPANMMLVPEPGAAAESTLKSTLKILDIGLGRALFEEGSVDQLEEPDLTAEGVLLGTPDYMSPEQARDARSADIRSDIYSLGCVLYHLIVGQPPFTDSNIISQMIRHATETPKPMAETNPAVPDGLQQIVNWMMAKDPAQRYPTPERAAQALQMFLAAGTESGPHADDASLNKYLVWLERDNVEPVSPAAAKASVKVLAAGIPAKPALAVQASPRPGKGKRSVRKQERRHRATPSPGQPLEESIAAAADVELVAAPAVVEPWKNLFGLELSRREAIAFGIGAAAGGFVTLIASIIAFRRREKKPAVQQPADEDSNPIPDP